MHLYIMEKLNQPLILSDLGPKLSPAMELHMEIIHNAIKMTAWQLAGCKAGTRGKNMSWNML